MAVGVPWPCAPAHRHSRAASSRARLRATIAFFSVASFSARAASAAACCCFLMILCSLAMHHEVGALCLPLNQTSVSRAGEGLSASSTHERTSATRSKKAHGMRMRVKVRAAGMGVSRETQTAMIAQGRAHALPAPKSMVPSTQEGVRNTSGLHSAALVRCVRSL